MNKYFQYYENANEICTLIKSIKENLIKIDTSDQNIIITIYFENQEKLTKIDFKLLKTKIDQIKLFQIYLMKLKKLKKKLIK